MGGKVLVPTREFIVKLIACRLAADICNVPTILVARTNADAAKLITSDVDERDHAFIRAIATPNLALQKLTTREPDPDMLEVSITALQTVLETESEVAAPAPASA